MEQLRRPVKCDNFEACGAYVAVRNDGSRCCFNCMLFTELFNTRYTPNACFNCGLSTSRFPRRSKRTVCTRNTCLFDWI